MIRTAVAVPENAQVFVDSSGRRKRLLAIAGFLVAIFAALYMGVVGASVVQASGSGLATKATVATSATASTSASASASSASSS
jgi:hypothetical protein